MKTVQKVMFAEYPPITVIPSFDDPIEIEKVAPVHCHVCGISEIPVWCDHQSEWFPSCHHFKCGKCDFQCHIDNAYWQGGSNVCNDCHVPRPEPEHDDYGDDEYCPCGDCPGPKSEALTPGWVRRGVTATVPHNLCVKKFIGKQASRIDPTRMMAEFYVSDYVMAVTGAFLARSRPYGTSRRNPAYRSAMNLYDDAKRHQDYVVAQCDDIFRDYLLGAIGGEARHYPGDGLPGGRATAWTWFIAAALETDRVSMIRDCVEIFSDEDSWGSGMGGKPWHDIAAILLARETGKLDARTFVDRVFTLQHNGGSALNKVEWNGPLRCEIIGDAHAANVVDFDTIFLYCDKGFINSLFLTEDGFLRLSTYGLPKAEIANLVSALIDYSDVTKRNDDIRKMVCHSHWLARDFRCQCDACVLTNADNLAALEAERIGQRVAWSDTYYGDDYF